MPYRGFFLDDSQEEAELYCRMFSNPSPEGLVFSALPIVELTTLARQVFEATPSIVALDYRLDENAGRPGLGAGTYKGTGLAQLLRDHSVGSVMNDFPVVLVSTETKFKQSYSNDGTAHDLFDRTYVKERIEGDRTTVQRELRALCDGYAILKKVWTSGDRFALFALSPEEVPLVVTQQLVRALSTSGAPHIASRYLLRNVVDRTGILYSDSDVAARLGIDPDSFEKVVPLLADRGILYRGIFCNGWRRWWAHRFDQWAEVFFGRRPIGLTGAERTSLLNNVKGLDLSPARSPWNGSSEEHFAFACACCKRPTESRHSLSLFDGPIPSFCTPRRSCWDCAQTDRLTEESLFVDDLEKSLLLKVQSIPKGQEFGE